MSSLIDQDDSSSEAEIDQINSCHLKKLKQSNHDDEESQIISKSAIRKSLVGSFLGEEDEEERANQEVFITKS